VLGAKLARFVLTCACIVAGGYIGLNIVAPDSGFHPVLCLALGGAAVGTLGYLSYRLWVGILAAFVMAALALGAFSYHRVMPCLAEIDPGSPIAATELPSASDIVLPSPEQLEQAKASAKQKLTEYWDFAKQRDADLEPHARSLGLTAALFGLLLGVAAVRLTVILCTSFLGTLLVGSGVTGLVSGIDPRFYKAVASHPHFGLSALGLCFVISLILQARLTRNTATKPAKTSDNS